MEPKKDIFDHLKVRKTDTPDPAYFENLANQVIATQKKEVKVIPLYKKPLFWMTAAAASIIVVFAVNLKSNTAQYENVLLALNDFAIEDIRTYIDNNIDDFDDDLIAEFVDESEIVNEPLLPAQTDEPETESITDITTLENVNEEEILQYLEDEEIDIYDLLDEESFI